MKLHAVTYLVEDYDAAITWFREALGFELLEDTPLGDEKRWVRVGSADGGTCFLLAKAGDQQQREAVSHAAGGRVAYFCHTDNFARDHARMKNIGVEFMEDARHEPYGIVAVFRDLYGNLWDLIEPATR
jgi:catechol 2,3-dioxygenase-like lactoylglutathione lyase family enzyme